MSLILPPSLPQNALLTGVGLDENSSGSIGGGSDNDSGGTTAGTVAAKQACGSSGGTTAGGVTAKLADVGLARMLGQDSLPAGKLSMGNFILFFVGLIVSLGRTGCQQVGAASGCDCQPFG